ncbi:MFS transporter, partial [Pseudomonas aeruginosa]|uniref:MFS transporter n=1 Tax=Pseudomonas aeruginosa TaxID=287 RepID=UPI0020C84450
MNSSQGFPRLALFLCGCAAFLNLYTTQGIFDELAASFHISAHQSNWSITATTLAVALAAPFVGRLSGGRERSRVIAFAASLLCVPMLLAAHAGSFAAFLLWRFAEGMLIPLLFASSVAYIGERWSGGAVIELTSLYVAGTILGGFAGRFLTGLLTEEWDWRVAFRILAGLTLLIAVAIRALLPANSGRHSPAPGKRPLVSRELFRAPLLSSYAVGFCVLFSQVADQPRAVLGRVEGDALQQAFQGI